MKKKAKGKRQKKASEDALKFSSITYNVPINQRTTDNQEAKKSEATITTQSWSSYIYEHMTPKNIALATIGTLGVLWTGYIFRNEIHNFFTHNNNPAPKYMTPTKDRNNRILEAIIPQRAIENNQAMRIANNVITNLEANNQYLSAEAKAMFRQEFSALIRRSGADYNYIMHNYNCGNIVSERVFDQIISHPTLDAHKKVEQLNIGIKLIKGALPTLGGRSNVDKTQMFNHLNVQQYKYLTYLMYKMVYGQKTGELDSDSATDEQTLDNGLSDYEIAANEEVNQAETSPNIAIYSKQALTLLLDEQATPLWEMLKDQLTCSNTLVTEAKEATNDDQVNDDTCPAMDIAPLSLAQKFILAYEPGTCHITMKSLQAIGYTTGLQSLVSYFINSGANPYTALANKLALIPLGQSMLIDKLCDNVDAFFANQASAIYEDILYKNLLEEVLSNMSTKEVIREAFISENDFVPEYNSYSNTTATDYGAYNQTDDSYLTTEPSILLGLTIPKLTLDYHSA